MPTIDNKTELGTSKNVPVEGRFVSELSFALRDAYKEFMEIMDHNNIRKEDPRYNTEYIKLYPVELEKQLRGLFYKYTVGKYDYLTITFEQLKKIVTQVALTSSGTGFFNELKYITLKSAKLIPAGKKVTALKQEESMSRDKALKIKVLLDKVLIEAKTSKRVTIKEGNGDINESTAEYWLGYEKDTSGQGAASDQRRMNDISGINNIISAAIRKWNAESDSPVTVKEKTNVIETANKFFDKFGWININIIQAIIMQGENIDESSNVVSSMAPKLKEDVLSTEPKIEVGKTYRYDTAGGQSLNFRVKGINPETNEVTIEKIGTGREIVRNNRLGYSQFNNALQSGSITLIESNLKETEELDEYRDEKGNKLTKDNSPRPSRMARPNIDGMTKNAKAYWPHLYIQDEAEDILQDKYGNEKGSQYFQGLLNAPRFGGFYQATTNIVMEKFKMYQELGERPPSDYFDESYFSVWKRWMASKGKTFKVGTKETPKSAFNQTGKITDNIPTHSSINKPTPSIAQPTSIKTPPVAKRSSNYDSKDEMRINDIMKYAKGDKYKALQLATTMAGKILDKEKVLRRANAAEDMNYHQLSNIFLKRYIQLGGK